MKVLKIKAKDRLSHGRLMMDQDQVETIEADEARELEKAGLVTIEGGEEEADDLLGETKMAPITANKMEKPASNKQHK